MCGVGKTLYIGDAVNELTFQAYLSLAVALGSWRWCLAVSTLHLHLIIWQTLLSIENYNSMQTAESLQIQKGNES